MKKLFGFSFVAALVATTFISCGGSSVAVKTQNDTLNYAFGAANAAGIRQYVIKEDTVSQEALTQFCNGFTTAFKDQDQQERLEYEGLRLGMSMAKDLNAEFLFGDSLIPTNKALIVKSFDEAIHGIQFMEPDKGHEYFDMVMNRIRNGENVALSAGEIDSINMVMGLLNGSGARRYMIGKDTTDNDLKVFMKAFENAVSAETHQMFIEGMNVGSMLKQQLAYSPYLLGQQGVEVNNAIISRGLTEGIVESSKAIMTAQEAQDYITESMARISAENNREAAAKGEAFLTENATKEGVVVTESGLQYKVITMGTGAKPAATDRVKVHYHGTLIDGTVFDSSVERGEPIEFPLDGVIKGWTEGVQLMPVGSKFVFYIPYQLAYGERGAGELIGPCEALIFEVELLDIVK